MECLQKRSVVEVQKEFKVPVDLTLLDTLKAVDAINKEAVVAVAQEIAKEE